MLYKNFFPLAPLVDSGTPANRSPQRLSGTGTAESRTSRGLITGKVHLLCVGAAGVRIRVSATGSVGAGAVDPTRDVVYGPWSQVPFVPDQFSQFVYAEAADGAAAYECVVYQLQS